MSYHYVREPGEEGNIITNEGEGKGLDLATLLSGGRPPLRVAIEIGSALADILTIAEEDKAIHGDIKPANVRVDANGAVSLDGFGQVRRTTRAPEGKPVSHQTDVFGLGVILHSILSTEPLGLMPRDAEGHDGAVVDRVLSMDFTEVEGKRWVEDVRRFLCLILAYEPTERPAPLDAANVLAQVAGQCPGQSLGQWAARAVPAAGGQAPERRPAAPVFEDLGGPEARSGPLSKGSSGAFQKNNRQAPSAKGESTAFFSKAKIAAMLSDEDDESDEAPPPPRPALQAPAGGRGGRKGPAAAPVEDLGGPSASRFASPEPIQRKDAFTEEEFFGGDDIPTTRPAQQPAGSPFARSGGAAPPPTPTSSPFAGPGFQISGPVVGAEQAEPTPDEDEAPKPSRTKWIVLGVAALFFGCTGLLGAGGAAWWYFQGRTDAPEASDPVAAEAPVAEEEAEAPPAEEAPQRPSTDKDDTGGPAKEAPSAPVEAAPPPAPVKAEPPKSEPPKTEARSSGGSATASGDATRKTAPSSGGKASGGGTRKTDPAPAPTPAPAPAVTEGPYEVKVALMGSTSKAAVSCGDGQSRKFSGTTRMIFTGTVSCRIEADGKKGAFTATREGSVTCSPGASDLSCING